MHMCCRSDSGVEGAEHGATSLDVVLGRELGDGQVDQHDKVRRVTGRAKLAAALGGLVGRTRVRGGWLDVLHLGRNEQDGWHRHKELLGATLHQRPVRLVPRGALQEQPVDVRAVRGAFGNLLLRVHHLERVLDKVDRNGVLPRKVLSRARQETRNEVEPAQPVHCRFARVDPLLQELAPGHQIRDVPAKRLEARVRGAHPHRGHQHVAQRVAHLLELLAEHHEPTNRELEVR
mmetsp:Transcript_3861/g.11183  ORF Transcript_3861/g.11183 Transcript_3861/m.11183 type:complete len:233 (-) Transcript_3861:3433-4131(-)